MHKLRREKANENGKIKWGNREIFYATFFPDAKLKHQINSFLFVIEQSLDL